MVTVREVSTIYTANASQMDRETKRVIGMLLFLKMIAEGTAKQMAIGYSGAMENAAKATKKFNTAIDVSRRQLFGMMISTMFFGMVIKRTFEGIIRSSTTAFQRIMEESEYAGTNIARLSAHINYFKFVLGSTLNRVLGPYIEKIEKIIVKMVDWIQQHPSATAALLGLGVAIGTAVYLIGMLTLGIVNGVVPAMKLILIPVVKKLYEWLSVAATTAGTTLLGALLNLAAAGAGILWLIRLVQKFGGGWEGLWELTKSVLRGIARLVVGLADTVITAFDAANDAIVVVIAHILDQINALILKINQKFNKNIGTINLKWTQDRVTAYNPYDLFKKYIAWEEQSWMAPKGGYASGREALDMVNPFSQFNMGDLNVNIPEAPKDDISSDEYARKIAEYTKEQLEDEILRRTIRG